MSEKAVQQLSLRFAIRVVKLVKFLRSEKKEYTMSDQLLRSGTSIGANISEAEYSIRKNDFTAKIYISYKECGETLYWLKVLYATDYLTEKQYQSMKLDCEELLRLLTAITKTLRKNS